MTEIKIIKDNEPRLGMESIVNVSIKGVHVCFVHRKFLSNKHLQEINQLPYGTSTIDTHFARRAS